jgi:oxygen-independent coproporphyrinogen III oxidase
MDVIHDIAPRVEAPSIDRLLRLSRRYDRPGPRYTSYPTAPQFHSEVGGADYDQALGSLSSDAQLSLYVHLPFCRSLCNYCGCHMMVTQNRAKIARYVDYVKREIDLVAGKLSGGQSVVQLHWGGGTPTFLEPFEISDLMTHMRSRFDLAPDAEVSIEADPRGLTEEHVHAARESGFNRISFGVQDFDVQVQNAIGRVQPLELVSRATDAARRAGFLGISYDLIYGLPLQTPESFSRTVETAMELRPDRMSVFSYAHVPWLKKHQQLIDEALLPSPDAKLRMLAETTEQLSGDGPYVFIGMDHFALPNDPLARALLDGTMERNFQGYSTAAGDALLAFGISGISQLPSVYMQNIKALPPYYQAIDEGRLPVFRGYTLDEDDVMRRDIIMQMMCRFEIDKMRISTKYEIDFDDVFADAIEQLQPAVDDGLVIDDGRYIRATEIGRYFVRNLAMPFDRYLSTAPPSPMYSRTV